MVFSKRVVVSITVVTLLVGAMAFAQQQVSLPTDVITISDPFSPFPVAPSDTKTDPMNIRDTFFPFPVAPSDTKTDPMNIKDIFSPFPVKFPSSQQEPLLIVDTLTITREVDVSVTKTESADPVLLGNSLIYTVTITNAGPDEAINVILTDTLSDSVNLISAISSKGVCTNQNNVITCSIGNMLNGEQEIVTIEVNPTTAGNITNLAVVSHDSTETSISNDSAPITTSVIQDVSDISITSLSTDSLINSEIRNVILSGNNFDPNASVKLVQSAQGVSFGQVEIIGTILSLTSTEMLAQFDLATPSEIPMGDYNVIVTNPDQSSSSHPITIFHYFAGPAIAESGTLGFPVGFERTNFLDIGNFGNDVGMFFIEIQHSSPGLIELKIGPPDDPIWDSEEQVDPSKAELLLTLDPGEVISLPMTWRIPPENVLFPDLDAQSIIHIYPWSILPSASAQKNFLVIGGDTKVTTVGIGGLTKEKLKGIITDVLIEASCETIGELLSAFEADNEGFTANVVKKVIKQLGKQIDAKEVTLAVAKEIGKLVIPGLGLIDFIQKFNDCLDVIKDEITDQSRLEGKRILDQFRFTDKEFRSLQARESKVMQNGEKMLKKNGKYLTAFDDMLEQAEKDPCRKGITLTNTYSAKHTAPWDPNDKRVASELKCELGEVDGEIRCVNFLLPISQSQQEIDYTIQFENKKEATAAAVNVVITDVLDSDLDPSTVTVLSSSRPDVFSFEQNDNTITFRFTGINLPPNVNPPEGDGFVQFRIIPKGGLSVGDEIRNKASIVFDFNPPIDTPETLHTIVLDDLDGDGFDESLDCNDQDASINPNAVEIRDGIDNDCNGKIDDGLPPDGGGDVQGQALITGTCGVIAELEINDVGDQFNLIPSDDIRVTLENPGNAPARYDATRTTCTNDDDLQRDCTLKFSSGDLSFAAKTELPEPFAPPTTLAEVVGPFDTIFRDWQWRMEMSVQEVADDAAAGLKQKVTVTVDAICDRDDFGNSNQVCPDFATSFNGDCICDLTGNPPNNNACPNPNLD